MQSVKLRIIILSTLLALIFTLFTFRLMYLQILKGTIFKNRAERNQTRSLKIPSYRSIIYDRNKKSKLAYNERSLVLTVIEAHLPQDNTIRHDQFQRMGHILDMTPSQIEVIIKEKLIDPYTPIVLQANTSLKTISQFAEKIETFPGILWENQPKRVYPLKKAGFHVIGYLGQIDKEEYSFYKEQKEYYLGAMIGKRGIEKQYDEIIRGRSGTLSRTVNVIGQVLQQEVAKEPIQGNHIVLTIDARLQQKTYNLMKDYTGAAIITHVTTGEILALVSTPSIDPIVFNDTPESQKKFHSLVLDPKRPFLNRTIQGKYPPSSPFKLISAAAFLRQGVDPSILIKSTGAYAIGNRLFRDWKLTGHGNVDMKKAIAVSANTYFYHYSQSIGRQAIFQMARDFGFTKGYQIDLPDENTGFLPDDIWFRKTHKRRWSLGDTANIVIGQGDTLTTPLEINMMTSIIANKGTIYKPFILKAQLSTKDKSTIWHQEPIPLKILNLSPETFTILQEGMANVVKGEGTAGWLTRYKMIHVPIAGKSGTAQTGYTKNNGLFTAYAPYGQENVSNAIAVTVLLEQTRTGAAIRIATELLNYYFDILYPEQNPLTQRNN